jgi:hypothetical protein
LPGDGFDERDRGTATADMENGADRDMSKSNVNPNHYKVAGRERQGEDIAQIRNKQRLAESQVRARYDRDAIFPKAPPPEASEAPEPETAADAENVSETTLAAPAKQAPARRARSKSAGAKAAAARRRTPKRATASRAPKRPRAKRPAPKRAAPKRPTAKRTRARPADARGRRAKARKRTRR